MEITAVIIARNEEKMIGECLESLSWTDEIVVVDNGSTDGTAKIAKKYGSKIYNFEIPASEGNFSKIREFAFTKSQGSWLLFVDADERVTPALRDEIKNAVNNSTYSAYAIPRQNIFLGHKMRWGGWWPDYVVRLMRKDKLKGYKGELHEQPEVEGEVGKLKNSFIHITHRSISSMVEKTNKWSEIEAKLMKEAGHPKMNIPRFITAMFREFWYRAVLKLGFLDGPVGIIEIIYQMFSRFVSYAKLYEMQERSKIS